MKKWAEDATGLTEAMEIQPVTLDFGERRSGHRYPVDVALTFETADHRTPLRTGTTRVLNMSGRAVAFCTLERFGLHSPIRLTINWPVLLAGVTCLKLIIDGRVVRSNGQVTAVLITKYQFRTRGR